MGIMTWADERIKKMNKWDISALKLYCVLIGIVIGAYIPAFVKQYLTAFIVVIVVLIVWLLWRMFKR